MKYFRSLKVRIIFSMVLMVVVIFPIIGLTISGAYEKHMLESIKNELKAYSYSLLAVAEVEQQQLVMPEALVEDQFNINQSGLYAAITSSGSASSRYSVLWTSTSLTGLTLPENLFAPAVGQSSFYVNTIDKEKHFVYSFTVSFQGGEEPHLLTLHLIKAQNNFLSLIVQFKQQLWVALIVLMILFICFQMVWLIWTLSPLTKLKKEIYAVEKGHSDSLKGDYPHELQQVTNQLNVLIKTEQSQRKRFRNALSDLAHSLKTPLAVIQSQSDLTETTKSQLGIINNTVEHQLKRAQSAGQSAWHLGIAIAPLLEKITSSLSKIYRDKNLTFRLSCSPDIIFKGDEADLMEILGNLMDNGSKAAKSIVDVSIKSVNNDLLILVSDDGPGICEAEKDMILQRGTRADTYTDGHGIGLAIVRDLITSYDGSLSIEESEHLCGACFAIRFSA